MIYKVSLDHMLVLDSVGFTYIMQNETNVLYQSDQTLPHQVTAIETYDDSKLASLYTNDEWQQPEEE